MNAAAQGVGDLAAGQSVTLVYLAGAFHGRLEDSAGYLVLPRVGFYGQRAEWVVRRPDGTASSLPHSIIIHP